MLPDFENTKSDYSFLTRLFSRAQCNLCLPPVLENKAMNTCASSPRVTFDQRITSFIATPVPPGFSFVVSPPKTSHGLIHLLSFMLFVTAEKKGMYTFLTQSELTITIWNTMLCGWVRSFEKHRGCESYRRVDFWMCGVASNSELYQINTYDPEFQLRKWHM